MDLQVVKKCRFALDLGVALQERNIPMRSIEASEKDKTLETVMEICSWLLEKGADRDALVLAVGGGITTDMVGFAASIYKRGVRFAYVPTTLLSQVDAAIGGKTGVNFEKYKNILGVIRQPEFTYMTSSVLSSLPYRDFMSGAAELLKTFIIEDKGNYESACRFLSRSSDEKSWREAMSRHDISGLISAAASVKAGVVSRDQFEKGERRKLNLGHTFAHAIETLAQQRGMDITHGEAVSMGMIMAAELAERLGVCQPETIDVVAGLAKRLEADFRSCGLPIDCPFSIDEMADCMKKDKKAEGGKVHFILPQAIGDVVIVDLTVQQVVELMNAI
jgi:3-dehydroquinate synthase